MRFNDSDAVADEGVAVVYRLFSRELKWIFREVPRRDVGIDAQVEVCRDRIVTSRLLALQIKSGESYFDEYEEDGWTYRGNRDHLEYYLAHSLPVVMVLYDPRNGGAWWQHVSKSTVRRTDKGWALFVPREQRLGEQARTPLETIAQLVTAEERVQIGPVKPLRRSITDLAPIYDVLHSATQELFFTSPYISREFIAILDFLSARVPIRGVVAETQISLEAASILADRSQLALRCFPAQSGMFHDKWIIVDRRVAWASSANLTWRPAMEAFEVLFASTDKARVQSHLKHFEDIWARAIPLSTILRERAQCALGRELS
jgi:phosphatidylserine/phosphatidylglycerophosphate/cardiolipin synthase-like enzyme